jgi:hypothetical protein
MICYTVLSTRNGIQDSRIPGTWNVAGEMTEMQRKDPPRTGVLFHLTSVLIPVRQLHR